MTDNPKTQRATDGRVYDPVAHEWRSPVQTPAPEPAQPQAPAPERPSGASETPLPR